MRGVLPFLLLAVACGPRTYNTETPPEDVEASNLAQATALPPGEGTYTVDPGIAGAASRADVEKLKVRLEPDGQVSKLSLYHRTRAEVPELVHQLAARTYPGSKAVSYEIEWYPTKGRVFEVEVETQEGKRCEVAGTPDGKLMYTECHVPVETLPAAVTQTLERTLPGAKILEAEHKMGEAELYTIEAEVDGGEHYLFLTPQGDLRRHLRRYPAVLEVPVP